MLPKKSRVTARHDFNKVRKYGRVVATPFFSVAYLPKKVEGSQNRFGFITSKKLSKRAVIRNRAKRMVREAVRLWLKERFSEDGEFMDVVFIIRRGILDKGYEEISRLVNQVLPKIFKP